MRYIKLTDLEKETLEFCFKNHPKAHVRKRCQSLLLSNAGWRVKQIALLHHVRCRTIYTWFDRWDGLGIAGLTVLPGRGIKPKLSTTDEALVETIKKKALKSARSLKKLAAGLTKELGFEVTRHMLRRFLKKLGYSWKRFRKSLKKKQNEEEYKAKLADLKQLIKLYKSNFIDLYFADESGFNMEGYIPYGWQPKGEYIEITPAKTKGTQIFGLMSLDNDLESYAIKGSVNSAVIMAFLDDFKSRIKQPTAVVLDNAPIHHSKAFEAKIEKWKDDDLYIFFLPRYSPHLNPIEILWRMIKYHWLHYEHLESQGELDQELEKILCNFGTEYTIDFKEQRHREKVSIIYM